MSKLSLLLNEVLSGEKDFEGTDARELTRDFGPAIVISSNSNTIPISGFVGTDFTTK